MGKNIRKKANVFKGASNPFNIKLNREKHSILGKKAKGTKGLRGFSRAASHAKRKELYHKTKLTVEKANHFLDRRLMDGSVPSEESAANRLVKERKKKLKKSNFNLNDEEDLTHRGMPLNEMKKIDGKASDSDDEDKLDAEFVNKVHFGGFHSDRKETLSHKEIIDQLIVESKLKKQDKRIEREFNADLTEKLDQDWKKSLSLLSTLNSGKNDPSSSSVDPYDVVSRTLKFESRATASARTKTPEELEKEEKERNLKLENERLSRMVDDYDSVKSRRVNDHLSADSIIDDFDLQPLPVVDDDVVKSHYPNSESEYSDSEESVSSSSPEFEAEKDAIDCIEAKTPKPDIITNNENDFKIPGDIDKFEKILEAQAGKELTEVIDEIVKPFLKTKSDNIRQELGNFFGVLLDYSLKNLRNDINISAILTPHLHSVAEVSELGSAQKFLSLLDEEQQMFQNCKGQKKKKDFPRLESLVLLKYCSAIYSVSDFRHPTVTPAVLYMCDILSSNFLFTPENIISRIFVCSIVSDIVSQSKRIAPEVVTFLNKVLSSAILDENQTNTGSTKNKKFNLVFNENLSSREIDNLDLLNCNKSMCDFSTKLSIIYKTVNLLQKFAVLYRHFPSCTEIFTRTLSICSKLPTTKYPANLTDSVGKLIDEIKQKAASLCPLTFVNTKPKPLKLFEPLFESKFNKNCEDVGKKFKQVKGVSQKIRKEERGLLREMRRDVQVIAAEKLSAQLESDAERKRKVKELYHDLAVQEGEYKKLMKKT